MFDVYCYPANRTNEILLEFSDLPLGAYDVYLYGHGAGDIYNATFVINGEQKSTQVGPFWNNNQLLGQNWIEGAHYARFNGVLVLSTNSLVIHVLPGQGGYSLINGLQLHRLDDGIPAAWRMQYFGSPVIDERTAAISDPDGDGASNYQEYLAGTDPANAQSKAPVIPLLQCAPAWQYFTNFISVSLNTVVTNGVIHYTLDGSNPSLMSPVFKEKLEIDKAATAKAQVFLNGYPVSEIITQSYVRWYSVDDDIPDAWREQYFGAGYHTDPRVAADADPDGDGAINLTEYLAGTNPLDAQSVLKLIDIHMVPVVSWTSVSNHLYAIRRKDNLNTTNWLEVVTAFTATNDTSSYTDYSATNRQNFYWIVPLGQKP
jgi:uncharacterized protein YbaR (Trm112 family)